MSNKVQAYRSQMQMTQTELSEKSGLSLRTIQRIESGVIPKGYTLKSVANALNVQIADLVGQNPADVAVDIGKVKLINMSALFFISVPFGNLIFPLLLMRGTQEQTRKTAVDILGLQLVWTLVTSIVLIVSPAIQVGMGTKFPVLIAVLVVTFSINALIIIRNAIALDKNAKLAIFLKFRFL